jgi:hypothetical protein
MNPFEPQKRAFYQGNIFYEPFINKEGRKISRFARCDIMIPGDYDFGLAEEPITITVESGVLIHNGIADEIAYDATSTKPLRYETKQLIAFRCAETNTRIRVTYEDMDELIQ